MATAFRRAINMCVIGHVDSGKSTTVGNLVYQLGFVGERVMEKLKNIAETKGKESFRYAFVTDTSDSERDRGITINNTLIHIKTSKFELNIIDCPGHKDFIKNMVTGAAQADVGIVIVPCAANEFEKAISGGTLKSHITISGIVGVKKLIVGINKTDAVPEGSQKQRFEEVRDEMKRIISKIHPDKDPIIIPISGYKGINIVEKGEKFSWFEGTMKEGQNIKTLEGAIDFQSVPERPIGKPLRMPIVSIHKISGIGTVYTGRVDAGVIKPGMQVTIQPADICAEIKSLEIHKEAQTEVMAGDNCGLALKSITKGDITQIKAGNVVSEAKNSPIVMFEGARAKIMIIDHPKGIKPGYCPVMDLGTHHVPVKLVKFLSKKAPGVKETITDPDLASKGDTLLCVIQPQKSTVMEVMTEYPSLAKFALRDGGAVVGIGAIEHRYSADEFKEVTGISAKTEGKGKVVDKKKAPVGRSKAPAG
ncbi:translation elongation factor Tu [Hamiltosporidium magnivora]|uniref:Translation elongation factor Tu n=1 Tax=Hamiltosporidium magnivora TaxID=148818 RepID=A0A4Q9LH95_9MICR|nr:translation elongation factor Tu [Hamiltosporidium magnivora]